MRQFLIAIICILIPLGVSANTISVPGSQSTIQAGIDAAIDGDTVLVAPGTYSGTGNRDLDFGGKKIVVIGSGGRDSTIIDCGGTFTEPHRGFEFATGEDSMSVVSGFTITNGYQEYGGAISCVGTSPKIENCRLEGNTAGSLGGGAYCTDSSAAVFDNVIFNNNESSAYSAGLQCRMGANAIVRNCLFERNISVHGAGVAIYSASPQFERCIFSRNESSQSGGGVFIQDNSSPIFNSCTFYGNTGSSGSAVFAQERFGSSGTSPHFDDCIIAFGGGSEAVYVLSATPVLGCTDIYGVIGGNWTNEISSQLGVNGNFSADPLFCDTSLVDLLVSPSSPCVAANNTCGRHIGAGVIGCYPSCCVGMRGNINNDSGESIDVSDLAYLVDWCFRFGPPPYCLEEADVNGDERPDISDVVYLVSYMFVGGPAPAGCPAD